MLCIANIYAAPVAHAEPFLPPSASIVETQEDYDVVDKTALIRMGETLLIWFYGRQQYARWEGNALITDDGEAIEGEALDDVSIVAWSLMPLARYG